MAKEQSSALFAKATDYQDKLDYFIATVTGAIATYGVQSYKPVVIGWDRSLLEPLALLLLTLSFFVGLQRLKACGMCLRYNFESMRHRELAEEVRIAIQNGDESCTDHFGQEFNRSQMFAKRAEFIATSDRAIAKHSRYNDEAQKLYEIRNFSLAAGFLILVLSKLLAPYTIPQAAAKPAIVPPVINAAPVK